MIPVHFITKQMPVIESGEKRFFYLFYLMVGQEESLVVAVEPEFHSSLTNAEQTLVEAGESLAALLESKKEALFDVTEEMLHEPIFYIALSEEDDQIAFKIKHPVFNGLEDRLSEIFGKVINSAYLTS